MPIIQHFNQTNKSSYNLIIIDGNRDVQVVYEQIRQVFLSLIEGDIINVTKNLNNCINSQRWSDYNIYCNTNSINADIEIQVDNDDDGNDSNDDSYDDDDDNYDD